MIQEPSKDTPVIAQWCWDLIEPYLEKTLQNRGLHQPTKMDLLREFARVWPEFTMTIGVQEPWQGTIRFKWLARVAAADMDELLEDPAGWIGAHYGGGKFKLNLHHGLHFVNTRNFRPEGDARWRELPALAEE
jgi:hypothetical protein